MTSHKGQTASGMNEVTSENLWSSFSTSQGLSLQPIDCMLQPQTNLHESEPPLALINPAPPLKRSRVQVAYHIWRRVTVELQRDWNKADIVNCQQSKSLNSDSVIEVWAACKTSQPTKPTCRLSENAHITDRFNWEAMERFFKAREEKSTWCRRAHET